MPIHKETPTDNYTRVPNGIFVNLDLPINARFVLMYLYSLPGEWDCSYDRIAKKIGLSKNTVHSALKTLEKGGYLMRQKKSNGRKDYIIPNSQNLGVANSQKTQVGKFGSIYKTKDNTSLIVNKDSIRKTSFSEGKKNPNKQYLTTCYGVIEYLNKKTGRKYKPTDKNLSLINSRLKDGYSKRDIKNVIDIKCEEWMDCEKMSKYLRPETLFNKTKFDNYLNEYTPPKPKKKIIITENLEVIDEHGNYL